MPDRRDNRDRKSDKPSERIKNGLYILLGIITIITIALGIYNEIIMGRVEVYRRAEISTAVKDLRGELRAESQKAYFSRLEGELIKKDIEYIKVGIGQILEKLDK